MRPFILFALGVSAAAAQSAADPSKLLAEVAGLVAANETWRIEGMVARSREGHQPLSAEFRLLRKSALESKYEEIAGPSSVIVTCDGVHAWTLLPALKRYRKVAATADFCSLAAGNWSRLPTLVRVVASGACGPRLADSAGPFQRIQAWTIDGQTAPIEFTFCINPTRKTMVWERRAVPATSKSAPTPWSQPQLSSIPATLSSLRRPALS